MPSGEYYLDWLWVAPQASVIPLNADNILSALGIPTNWAELVAFLINTTIVNDLPHSLVDTVNIVEPDIPQMPTHTCE